MEFFAKVKKQIKDIINKLNYQIIETLKMSTQQNNKSELSNSEQRKKCLDVPKDQIRMMEQKEEGAKIKPQIIHIKELLAQKSKSSKQKTCEDKCEKSQSESEKLSAKCEKKLSPIKEAVSMQLDLLDFNIEPEVVAPKLAMRESQQELRRELYGQKKQCDNQSSCYIQKKNDLTSQTVNKIMKQLKQDEEKQNKQQPKAEKAGENGMKKKASLPMQNKDMSAKRQGMTALKRHQQSKA